MSHQSPLKEYAGMVSGLSALKTALSQSNIENYRLLTDRLANAIAPSAAISEIVSKQSRMLSAFNSSAYSQSLAISALNQQWGTLASIAGMCKTPEIANLQQSLLHNDFTGLQVFADSLKTSRIEAPNLALLRLSPLFSEIEIPRGLSSVVRGLHIDAAQRLASSTKISFDTIDKKFFVEASPHDRASITETNIICSSLQLLSGIDEADLISFLTQLEDNPAFACEHETGVHIREIISKWDATMGFDCECYYHARSLPEGAKPYTEAELRSAPSGYTGHGRYNYVGQSHYYFSDVEKGAILEVTKHTAKKRIQIATLHPTKPIRMIDLSIEVPTKNKFLEYCRFSPNLEESPKIRKEYLLPSYVANCCKLYKIEGIKYYGSKEYQNYVSWSDGYFEITRSEIKYTK